MIQNITQNIAAILLVAMFFSCKNSNKEIKDFLAEKNLPITVGKNVVHVYKDSGRITSRLETKLLHDFSNRKKHPYSEFPKGLKIVSIKNGGKDSITITGNYAITYTKTKISEIKGNVIVTNHSNNTVLETNQLFWDQEQGYIFTEESFRLLVNTDMYIGYGFESKENLTKWIVKDLTGEKQFNQKDL